MKIVPGDVARTVAMRVILAWAGLSVLAGAATLYFELERVNRMVLGLAANETKRFIGHIEAIGPEHVGALEIQAGEFLQGNFVSLRLYGIDKRKILEALEPGERAPRRNLPEHVHDLAPGELDHHHMFWADGRLLMQLLLPVAGTDGTARGYFEGVYEVDAADLRDIKAGLAANLALTLGVVLATAAVLYSVIAALNRSLIGLSADLLESNIELMEVLGNAIALRDSNTDAHNYRVTAYAMGMGKALRLPARQVRDLIAGALLHDAGKIGISDTILLKPGPLSPEEMDAMRRHVSLGAGIVARSDWLRGAREIVEFHHEKFDGSGYLKGFAAGAIPLGARIFAIVDVFDALTSRRPYKEPLPFAEAMTVLERGRGTHFDPALLDEFEGIAAEIYAQIGAHDDPALRRTVRSQVHEHFRLADAAAGG
ncbi:MAG: HD domain-containing phosphohydrolase [Burkholderiales bacterium]